MLLKEKNYRTPNTAVFHLVIALLLSFTAISTFGQSDAVAQSKTAESNSQQNEEAKKTILQPAIAELRGIAIGMTAEEVKDKLGKAKMADDAGFYYVFSDGESLRTALDADKKVRLIASIYTGNEKDTPKYEDVFGPAAAIEPQPEGKIYKLVRYPEAGYWVAYNRIIVGDEPMTTVTIQKMR